MPSNIESYYTPGTLYRYRSLTPTKIKNELAAISEGYVHCATFDKLNDPMEATHRMSSLLQRSKRYPKIAAELEAKVKTLGVASFSESRRIEPMWAYYADDFRGICIAYSVNRLNAALPDGYALARMGYNETPPLLSLSSNIENRARAVLCAKTLRWSQEREWRLFAPASGAAEYGSRKCVTGVYVGKRIADDVREKLFAVLDARKIPAHIMGVESYHLTFTRRPIPGAAPSRRRS